ncbi:MAG: ATPase, partial [Chromatiales bacterium]|nr:ATPase [Chromatiales bacterium]
MKELHDLELLLTAHTPIIVIESIEEIRAVQLFTRLGLKLQHPFHQWTVTEGLKRLEVDFDAQGFTADPTDALKHIKGISRSAYFLLLDFHPFMADPVHVRLIKEIAQNHENIPKTLIFLSHSFDIPAELRHLTARFELHLPDQAGIKTL